MRTLVVIGVGMTKFGKFPEIPVEQMGREAVWEAMKDAGMGAKDIQVAYLGHHTERREGLSSAESHLGFPLGHCRLLPSRNVGHAGSKAYGPIWHHSGTAGQSSREKSEAWEIKPPRSLS